MIDGKRVRLRPLDSTHLDATRKWSNEYRLAELLDRAWPVSDHEHHAWYNELRSRRDCLYMAIETQTDGRHIGNVWLFNIDCRHKKAELRVVIGDSSSLEKGLGSEAISLMCQFALDRLNLRKAYAFVLATNPRALKAFEKVGFFREGLLLEDRWCGTHYTDVVLLAKFLRAPQRD